MIIIRDDTGDNQLSDAATPAPLPLATTGATRQQATWVARKMMLNSFPPRERRVNMGSEATGKKEVALSISSPFHGSGEVKVSARHGGEGWGY